MGRKKSTHSVALPHVKEKKVVAESEAEAIEKFNEASGIIRSDHPYTVTDLRKPDADPVQMQQPADEGDAPVAVPVESSAPVVDPAGAPKPIDGSTPETIADAT